MLTPRTDQLLADYTAFVRTPGAELLARHAAEDPLPALFEFVRRTAASVPAYAAFLREHGCDPKRVTNLDTFRQLPLMTKPDYIARYPLEQRCRHGALAQADMLAVSSGSTGEPTVWPRTIADELAIAARFEQIFHDSFRADERTTLAVVCFPLGTWIGGMFTANCCRHLAAKGYPITLVTPGNNKLEILRSVRALADRFEQTVLLGYPPFLKEVIDAGRDDGIEWRRYAPKFVLAGEVFSEDFRELLAERAGVASLFCGFSALYGTADAGVLGNETPLSIAIRRFLRARPDAARALFGDERLPTLVQYDPFSRYFETHERSLVFSGDSGVPLVRYHIADHGGVIAYATLIERLRELGFDAEAEARSEGARGVYALPFVYLFGRSHFAVSFYGANVFPEQISIALEQPELREQVTGKFVLEVKEDAAHDKELWVTVELAACAAKDALDPSRVADAVLGVLRRLNSEFAHYAPLERQRPRIALRGFADPEYFPAGVKHRYSRK